MFDMYDMALGDGYQAKRAELFMEVPLNMLTSDLGRYRDCWLEVDENDILRVAVYARIGGNNRASYQANIDHVRTHPGYMFDKDDGFDSTYATFYFRFPTEVPPHLLAQPEAGYNQENWESALEVMRANATPPVDTDKRWKDAIANLEKNGMTERQVALSNPLKEALKQTLAMPPDPDGAVPIIYTDGRVDYHLPKKPEEGS